MLGLYSLSTSQCGPDSDALQLSLATCVWPKTTDIGGFKPFLNGLSVGLRDAAECRVRRGLRAPSFPRRSMGRDAENPVRESDRVRGVFGGANQSAQP